LATAGTKEPEVPGVLLPSEINQLPVVLTFQPPQRTAGCHEMTGKEPLGFWAFIGPFSPEGLRTMGTYEEWVFDSGLVIEVFGLF
jgi:hypothetical protein